MPITPTAKIWMNGELVDWADAKIHILTHTLHYGMGVFEGMRAYETDRGPAIFRLTDHINRMRDSARILGMPQPYSVEEIVEASKAVVRASGLPACYVRPIAYYGYGEMGLSTKPCSVDVAVACWPWGAYLGDDAVTKGVRMKVSSWVRHDHNTMRQFSEDKIAPRAAETDHLARYDWDAFHALVSMELPALGLPVEYGGAGADLVTQAIAAEELARVCASTSLMLLISKLSTLPITNFASEELKREYLPRIASGESQGSYCLSEADAGSDVASMTTRAVRDGDSYVLTGSKVWITNAGISDIHVVFAKTDPSAGHRGISAFVVEKDWGIQVTKLEEKMGIKGSPTGQLVFDEVRVPATHLIGSEGEGFKIAMHTLDRSRPTIGAQAVGIAQGALDYAVGYMRSTTGASTGEIASANAGTPLSVAHPARSMFCFTVRGTPWRGPSGAPEASDASAAFAPARASSASTLVIAFR